MKRFASLMLIMIPLTGCMSLDPKNEGVSHHTLDPEWSPLERIRERPNILISETAITTIGETAYVVDIEKWLTKHPVNSLTYRGKLTHEQLHSKRQLDYGLTSWIAKYSYDRDFMWAEESLGWYAEIQYLRGRGARISTEGVARTLSKYRNLTGRMISYEDALKWVQDVVAGRWRPPEDK